MARRISVATLATTSALILGGVGLTGCSTTQTTAARPQDAAAVRDHVLFGFLDAPATSRGGPVQLGAGDPLGTAVHAWYMALHDSEREAWAAVDAD